ncbi:MAG: hypothetical protein V4689_18785 [Verrucomicrobiota bacterium]
MPLNLTKEEVARLSDEQLDAYARVHLDSERTRRDLCDLASGRKRSIVVPIVASVLGIAGVIWFPKFALNPITLIVIPFALLFRFHMETNRRIDALVRLLNLERVAEKHPAGQAEPPDGDPPPN